jgi:hypothetical protein
MLDTVEKNNEKTSVKNDSANAAAYKPSIQIRRKQTRRLVAQVDEEKAESFDEYVRFISTCYGYEVSAGDVMNEILKAHFARDGGFKQWRAEGAKRETSSPV